MMKSKKIHKYYFHMKRYLAGFLCLVLAPHIWGASIFLIYKQKKTITIACDPAEEQVVQTALELFKRDCLAVFSSPTTKDTQKGDIIVGTVGKSSLFTDYGIDTSVLSNKKQAFLLTVSAEGKASHSRK